MSANGTHRPFWKRRLGDPLMALLTQGVTPDKLAATLAIGFAASLFPFFGLTTLLNLLAGLWFRMNQPLLQTLNYLLSPLQLVMILVYVRLGESIWFATSDPFSLKDILTSFKELSFGAFLQRFGWAGIHALSAWILSLPLIIPAIYYSTRPVLRRFATVISEPST